MTSSVSTTAPRTTVLAARDATIMVDESVAMSSLSLTTRGDRVLLVGAAGPLVTAIAGARPNENAPLSPPMTASVVSGELTVLERDVKSGAHRQVCGIALRDPPLPSSWSVQQLLGWAAELDGATPKACKHLVAAVIQTLSLGSLAKSRLRTLSVLERRVVVLGCAIVSQPAAVVVDDPFHELDASEAALMLNALGLSLYGRAAIVAVPRIRFTDASGELAKTTSDIVLVRDGTVVLHADAGEALNRGRLYEVTVSQQSEALRAVLAESGIELNGGPRHFSVVLPDELGPSVVLAAAARARAPITSCMPLIG